jgi:uncharacterized protein YpmB
MLKKMIALVAAVSFVLLLPTVAAAKGGAKSTPKVSGTISSWDDATKNGKVKDADGKETAFGWNEKTTVTGTPKIGEHATVSYTKDKAGKVWATHVSVGAPPAPPPAKK